MNQSEHKKAAKEFAAYWADKGYEKGESQKFWLDLLQNVLGVENPMRLLSFEEQVKLDHTSFIDVMIPSTHVMIEQKSSHKDLRAPIKQSDGSMLSPFQQAKRYSAELPYSERPRWIVCSNFKEFLIYDMERPNGEPESILLADLESEWHRLRFLVNAGDEHIARELHISQEAAKLIGEIYDALLAQYHDPTNPGSLRSLNVLCVRLVFCMYAEDTDIFGERNRFVDYLRSFQKPNVRRALIDLFEILDTPYPERDPYLDPRLAAFPYVNGGLFAETHIEIPTITPEIVDLITDKACPFDWSGISPTIFGAMFESTLNPETRRSGGMHYTSIENIHKVIDPLFLDALHQEYTEAMSIPQEKKRLAALRLLQEKLASLKFLDPACGSGNFLTETYISLRRLENSIIKELLKDQIVLAFDEETSPVKVSIKQFYGIEINDFAATVARTAMWIAESQMLAETEKIVAHTIDFLPLTTNANIVTADALLIDWDSVVPRSELNYIMGNPPFVGYSNQTASQKSAILSVYVDAKGKPYKTAGKIDFVAAWYFKAAQLMQGTQIHCAFVSTNSICQGEQVAAVWKPLYERFGIHIDYAYTTFKWASEASDAAAVHCVIVGFSSSGSSKHKIFEGGNVKNANNINPYLMDADTVFIESRTIPICQVPGIKSGGKPVEGGHLIFTEEEKSEFVQKEPKASKFFRKFVSGDDFIYNEYRWCLWLYNVSPNEYSNLTLVKERLRKVREFRLNSKKEATQKYADYPYRFMEVKELGDDYMIIPNTSSENRRYIPIGFLSSQIIPNNAVSFIPSATLYHFGVLTSNVHMAWMRAVCGRLESRYRYSNTIVYNNFPWPAPTEEQRAKIEQTAQAILDARALYPDCSLADLYDEVTMPPELRKAHQNNDRAVMEAYGLPVKGTTESSCVAHLFKMYQKMTSTEKK